MGRPQPLPPPPLDPTHAHVIALGHAVAEALNGTFKSELVKLHGPWRTRSQLEIAIIEWIDWYNGLRLHREIGDIPPAEHKAHWYRHNETGRQAVTT